MKTGLHLIGDLHDCKFSDLLENEAKVEELKKLISQKIKDVELTELGNFYHYFGPYSLTAVICLAESHISFHTWSEEKYTSFDVFVCNYQKNNSQKAREIFDYLIKEIFQPGEVVKKEIER